MGRYGLPHLDLPHDWQNDQVGVVRGALRLSWPCDAFDTDREWQRAGDKGNEEMMANLVFVDVDNVPWAIWIEGRIGTGGGGDCGRGGWGL